MRVAGGIANRIFVNQRNAPFRQKILYPPAAANANDHFAHKFR